MKAAFDGIIAVVGSYGSGKTEVSVNLAIRGRSRGLDVSIADLDLVNPYFRTREARYVLSGLGIEVILPPEKYLQADLPILTPSIAGMIRRPKQLTLLDVGGNDVGARVLGALADSIGSARVQVLQIVNPFRPRSRTMEECLSMRDGIERASRMAISGIIGNAHLIEETTVDDLYRGYGFVQALSEVSGLPLECVTVAEELLGRLDTGNFSCPLLPIKRQLVPPWKRACSCNQNVSE
jgi:hypothetical protein